MQASVEELFEGFDHLISFERKKGCICGGDNHVICYRCNGVGFEEQTYMTELNVSSIRMNNEGNIVWHGMGDITSKIAYDLIMKIELTDTDKFDLKFYNHKPPDVVSSVRVHIKQLGNKVAVNTLGGEKYVTIPKDHKDGQYLRIKEKGLVFNREGKRFRSDLLIKINLYK
jgi:DnaJ-class molecular chaperone